MFMYKKPSPATRTKLGYYIKKDIPTTTEHAFGHLSKMNNNLGPNSVRDKNIFSPGW